ARKREPNLNIDGAGATTIETSQNAGRPVIGANACGREGVGTKPAGSGGWNVPPPKDFAVIEVTSGSRKPLRLSQVAAAAPVGTAPMAPNSIAEPDATLNRFIMIPSLSPELALSRSHVEEVIQDADSLNSAPCAWSANDLFGWSRYIRCRDRPPAPA